MKRLLCLLIFLAMLLPLSGQSSVWKEMVIAPSESVWASSSLTETTGGRRVTYGPEGLFDGNISSLWVEGAEGDGIGESVTVMTQQLITRVSVVNGFACSQRLFGRNNRVREVSLSFIAGMTAPGLVTELDFTLYFVKEKAVSGRYELKDGMELQSLALYPFEELQRNFYRETIEQFSIEYPDLFAMALGELGIPKNEWRDPLNQELIREIFGFFGVKITIEDVYKGTHYHDTCVSELEFGLEEF
jgi:hypothetical protein